MLAACVNEGNTGPGAEPAATPDNATVNYFMTVAGQAAGFDHIGLYNTTCARMGDPTAGRERPPENRESPDTWGMQPARVFDNVYWLGEFPAFESNPGAWAVTTSEGIIVLDALFDYSVEGQIVGGLRKMGLDPGDIRYVLISHGHRDHYGGARFLQENFAATVLISEADWNFINERAAASGDDSGLPDAGLVQFIRDGDRFTLGDTTFNLYVTPGHTPGTVSYTLPVFDNGTAHIAAVWGGSGLAFRADSAKQQKLEAFRQYNVSALRFREIVTAAGADVMLGNHSYLVLADEKNALLARRQPGDPNPYVLGREKTVNYMNVAVACSAAGMASFN
ncbi:MAG: MBL fold metallo-hydrolase [Gammaproteobacteria bacterium]|nr:MBL fold metallo-hydrolase [Gammaproteobacteria bacterium]MDH5320994.1 MBL fold metallo-hydrolase [Gammaproteobacteria bacterium]